MMPKLNSKVENGSASLGDIDRSIETGIKPLMKTDRVENSSSSCDMEDVETGRCLSCASSLGNDSGFGSDTDDHVIGGLLNVSCDICSENKKLKIDEFIDSGDNNYMTIPGNDCGINEDDKIKTRRCDCCVDGRDKGNKVNCDDLVSEGKNMMKVIFSGGEIDQINKGADIGNTSYSFQNVQLTNCSESTTLGSSFERTEQFERRKDPTDGLCLDSILLYRRDISNDSGDVWDKDISTETQTHTTTRETADSVNSAAMSEDSYRLRTVRRRRRRCRVQDVNNNSTGPRNLTSFLRRVPLTFNDCFHEQGLLLLVACIIYTLILTVIISLICIVMETFKSAIGINNLKKIRKTILHYRHTRMGMAVG